MIKFFRKIRQRLLSENRFSKYLIYAIGEIILVVIGILFALQINNWNQNKINSSKEQEYLIGLKNDLESQIQAFKGRDNFYDQIINIGESILVDFSTKGSLVDIDSINKKLSYMMYALKFPDTKTTFTELTTTGQINLIKEKILRSNIIKYYQDSESDKEIVNSNISEVYYDHIFPFIKSSIIVNLDNFNMSSDNVNSQLIEAQLAPTFENNLSNPEKEFEVINAISLRIIAVKFNKRTIQTATTNAENLLNKINNALEKNNTHD